MTELEGRRVVVAGASGGIGRRVVVASAAAGASVVACGRDRGRLERAAAEAQGRGGPVALFEGDLTAPDVLAELAKRAGPVDGLVSCVAAPLRHAGVLEPHEQVWEEQLGVNLAVPRRMVEAFGPGMVATGSGSIVFVTSVASRTSQPGLGAYAASKAALDSYMRTVALELGASGVRANSVAPGLVDTDRTHHLVDVPRVGGLQRRSTPLGRLAEPDDIAAVVVWLLSEASRFVTGQSVAVDGGRSAGRYLAEDLAPLQVRPSPGARRRPSKGAGRRAPS